jgi:hypothetical protein
MLLTLLSFEWLGYKDIEEKPEKDHCFFFSVSANLARIGLAVMLRMVTFKQTNTANT